MSFRPSRNHWPRCTRAINLHSGRENAFYHLVT
jgi:hypothetical protein